MQFSTINNLNFEKSSRIPSNRTKENMLQKKILRYLATKNWFRVCSATAKMFELQKSDQNRKKIIKKNFAIDHSHIRF